MLNCLQGLGVPLGIAIGYALAYAFITEKPVENRYSWHWSYFI